MGYYTGPAGSFFHPSHWMKWALRSLSDREFLSLRAGQPEVWPRCGLTYEKWLPFWKAEYDRRFLLRPALPCPVDADPNLLVRAVE